MGIAASISSWWTAWKWVAILAALFAASAALNVWQVYRALTAPLRAENSVLARALDQITGIAEKRDRDDVQLFDRLEAIAARGEKVHVVYRQAAAAAPLAPECAPGQARVDAINQSLGPQP